MAKQNPKNLAEVSKGATVYLFDPEKNDKMIVRVVADKSSPLYDASLQTYSAREQDPGFYANILRDGVKQPGQLRPAKDAAGKPLVENGRPVWEIVAGSRRFLALLQANEERAKAGQPTHSYPWQEFWGASDTDALTWKIEENAQRADKIVTVKASEASMLHTMLIAEGKDEEEARRVVAGALKMPVSTLETLLMLQERIDQQKIHPKILERLDLPDGDPERLTLTAVSQLFDQEIEGQLDTLNMAEAEGNGHGGKKVSVSAIKKAKAKRKAAGTSRPTGWYPGARELARLSAYLEERRRRATAEGRKTRIEALIYFADCMLSGTDPEEELTVPEGWEPKAEEKAAAKK